MVKNVIKLKMKAKEGLAKRKLKKALKPRKPSLTRLVSPSISAHVHHWVDAANAGFWVRTGAFVIDYLILAVTVLPIEYLIISRFFPGALEIPEPVTGGESSPELLQAMLFRFNFELIVDLLYYWVLQTLMMGTLGKRVFGLRVVDESLKKANFQQMFVRWLMRIPSALFLLGGFLMVAFSSKKQGWHDRVAQTRVVHHDKKLDKKLTAKKQQNDSKMNAAA